MTTFVKSHVAVDSQFLYVFKGRFSTLDEGGKAAEPGGASGGGGAKEEKNGAGEEGERYDPQRRED